VITTSLAAAIPPKIASIIMALNSINSLINLQRLLPGRECHFHNIYFIIGII